MEDNENKLLIPSSTLEKLQCTICTKPLSLFPIYLSSELGSICGRCPTDNLKNLIHNTTYEATVENFRFPCCFLLYGCPQYLLPSETKAHENICYYRHVTCPAIQDECKWKGPCTQLVEHYENSHANYLMKQLDFEANFIDTFDENYLLLYGDEIFVFKRKADGEAKKLWCSVVYYGWATEPEDFSYQIKLVNGSTMAEKVFPKKPADSLEENITEIVGDEVKEEMKNPSVIVGSIEITVEEEVKKKDPPKKPNLSYDMLETIECPVCLEYMIPPIFQCLGGHSICGKCKESVSICPICREGIRDTRNFILEKMVNYLQYPCKNWENGCTEVAEGLKIKKHEKFCEFGSFHCPLKDYHSNCTFKSKLSNIHDHLVNEHHDNILEIDTVHVPFDEGILDDEDAYVLKYLDHIFVLHFRIKDDAFWWCFQLVGSPENSKKYVCEIDIIDNACKKSRIYMRKPCCDFTSKVDCFKEGLFFKLNFDQVKHFITDIFSYRVRILKDK